MRINHNIAALNTYRQLSNNNVQGNKALEKLSSGLRINKAGDDAAGLAISEKMRAQIRGLDQASRNAQDAISLIQTAEGGLNETHSILQRMRELATQAASDTNVDIDREEIQKEINQLTSEINRIGNTTEFNTMKLLNGGTAKTANIRYSVETAGVAEQAAVGATSAVNTVENSVAASTAEVTLDAPVVNSVQGAAAVGELNGPATVTASVAQGTGAINNFNVDQASVQATSSGSVADSFKMIEQSVTGGTGAAEVTELVVGASNLGRLDGFTVDTASVQQGTGAIEKTVITATGDTAATGAITYNLDTDGSADGTAYIEEYTVATQFTVGEKVTIGGVAFTAVAAGANADAGEFNIGASADDQAGSLKAAIDASSLVTSGKYVASVATDTITMTEQDVNGNTPLGNAITTASGKANYTFGIEITGNFTADDTITIGDQTFTAVEGAAGAGEFTIGSTISDTRDNIIEAISTASGTYVDDGETYVIRTSDPSYDNGGYADNNLIVFTNVSSATDANAGDMTDSSVAQTGETPGVYRFEVKTNFEAGQVVSINGYEFTASDDAGAVTADQANLFLVGNDVDETASNLKTAIAAAKGASAAEFANYTVDIGASGIYSDTIELTEVAGTGNDLTAADVTTETTAAVAAKYAIEITSNFEVGDEIEIGTQTFKAVASGAGAGQFNIGDTVEETRDNIITAVDAGGATYVDNGITYDITKADASWEGADENNLLVFTAQVAQTDTNSTAMKASAVTQTSGTEGKYGFEIANNFAAGETITINDYEFTAMVDNAPAVSNASVAGVAGTLGDNTIAITNHAGWAAGDTIEIDGQTFTAVASGADAAAGEFNLGADAAGLATSLVSALQANTTINDRYTIADNGDGTFDLVEKNALGNNASITVNTAGIGDATNGENAGAVAATARVDTYTITSDLVAGQTVTIDGETFTAVDGEADAAAGEFSTTGDLEARAAGLAAAINANVTLSASYTAAATSGGAFTLTEVISGTGGAVSAGAATIEENTTDGFVIGTTLDATAANLKDAIDLAKAAGATEFANYTTSIGAAGIYSDTIYLTEVAATGNDLAADDVAVTHVTAAQGTYSFEVSENFAIGDKIEIGGVTFTAMAADNGNNNTATTFEVGTNAAATAANLKDAIDLSSLVAGGEYTAALSTDKFGYANKITLTEATADGADLTGPTVSQVTAVQGQYEMELKTNFKADETIDIGGQTFTAKASGANAANGEFNVGLTTADTAQSLEAALTAKLGAAGTNEYTISRTGNILEFSEVAATGSAITKGATSGIGEVLGQYTFSIDSNFTVGDKITIDGTEFEAVASGADTANGKFVVGATIAETTDNLVEALNDSATNVRFTASVVTDNTTPSNPQYSIKMVENSATGTDLTSISEDFVQEVQGTYTFDVNTNFAAGDRLAIDGTTLVAGATGENGFTVGTTAEETAANIAAAINAHSTLGSRFTADSTGTKIGVEENAGEATGEDLADPTVRGDATAGEYSFQMSALKAGSIVTIDNQELTLTSGGTEAETAAALKTAIEANTTLNTKYTVAATGAEVTLTQIEGQESATAPTLTYTTQAGAGFRTQMQIGASTGQSMSLDVNDMRANALEITSATGTAGQTVEVEGKQYAVAWTSAQSVTNGTDDIAVEFALDVSTHDNATAAVKVINDAIEAVSAERSKLGAYQNRLEHTINNLGTSSENLTAAESRVRDVDMAKEMMEFTKNNILTQAAQAMLAQANQQPEGVLQLLR